jgi:Protein of unknown function (DUF2384)
MATMTTQPAVVGFSWPATPDLSKKEVQQRLTPAATRGLLKVARAWDISADDTRQLLGGISTGSFYNLTKGAVKKLDQDQLTRVSLVIGIFKALNILYSRKLADKWITLPNTNPMFGGETPLRYMQQGGIPAMVRVRQLLDARRGGK